MTSLINFKINHQSLGILYLSHFIALANHLKFPSRLCEEKKIPDFSLAIFSSLISLHAGEAIMMLLENYGNFSDVVAENIIKHDAVRLNDKCDHLQSILILQT